MRQKYREMKGIETGVYRECMEYVNQSFDFYVPVQFTHERGWGCKLTSKRVYGVDLNCIPSSPAFLSS